MNTQKKKIVTLLEQTPGDLKDTEIHMLKAKANIDSIEAVVKKRALEVELSVRSNDEYKNDKQRKKAIYDILNKDEEYKSIKKELRKLQADYALCEIEYKHKKRTMLNQRAICYLIGDEEC